MDRSARIEFLMVPLNIAHALGHPNRSTMTTPNFAIGEWLVCAKCGLICDAPFRPEGSDATEPELVLGQSLPQFEPVPSGEWSTAVSACCPRCGVRLNAIAVFEGHTLR